MSEQTSSEYIDQIFNYLDEFRQLPAYQLERRADIFFALHLKEILQGKLKVKIEDYIRKPNFLKFPIFYAFCIDRGEQTVL